MSVKLLKIPCWPSVSWDIFSLSFFLLFYSLVICEGGDLQGKINFIIDRYFFGFLLKNPETLWMSKI